MEACSLEEPLSTAFFWCNAVIVHISLRLKAWPYLSTKDLFFFLSRMGTQDNKFLFLFLHELWYSRLEFDSTRNFNIWQIKRDGISAIRIEAERIHFSSDVFVAVAALSWLIEAGSKNKKIWYQIQRLYKKLHLIHIWREIQEVTANKELKLQGYCTTINVKCFSLYQ